MRGLRWLAPALALGFVAPAAAHDFWLQPKAYWSKPHAEVPLTLEVGDGPARQRSQIPSRRITRFEAIGPDGASIDLRAGLHPGRADSDADLRFAAPGAYVVVLETDDGAESRLPAARFNAYLEDEGLTPALEQRRRAGRMGAEGSERYSRRAKTLVQVGPPDAASHAVVAQPTGLSLEIVLEQNPYDQPGAAMLPARVFYVGLPLAGALVKLTDLAHDAAPAATARTDAAGRATFPAPRAGDWRLNVVWTQPSPRDADTDFETVFSSLSFGFR